jgi:hypothetical protein
VTRLVGVERGVALIAALMAVLLLSALGSALALAAAGEPVIAASFRAGHEALYAAEAAVERAMVDLADAPDWTPLLAGSVRSGFVDGAPHGERPLGSSGTVDLSASAHLANCSKSSPCTAAELEALSDERPWGRNNPVWTLFAYGPLERLAPGGGTRPAIYLTVLVGDDPTETDADPSVDGGQAADGRPENRGGGMVLLRGEAFGPFGIHRVVEATVARAAGPGEGAGSEPEAERLEGVPATALRVLSWRAVK